MTVEQLLDSLGKPALVATELEQDDPAVLCCQGGEPRRHPDEPMPSFRGEALYPILSLYTPELSWVPEFLEHGKYFTFFVWLGDYQQTVEEGSLVVRRYDELPALKPDPKQPRLALSFAPVTDYPSHGAMHGILRDQPELMAEFEAKEDELMEAYPCHSGIKLGGYPELIQQTAFLEGTSPDFQIQIDGTSLYSYADSGMGYLCDSLTFAHWETF